MSRKKTYLGEDTFKVRFDSGYAVKHTRIPTNPEDTPQIIGWSAPARSGTTAFLYLLASQSVVDRAYFQPQKTLLRTGGPDFVIRAEDNIVCLKEVFGGDLSMDTIRAHDPIEILLLAGVPSHKITWVTMLREPAQAFGSLQQLQPDLQPEIVAEAQNWALALFAKHRANGVKMIPYIYEFARGNEEAAIKALFARLELPFGADSLNFDPVAIQVKLIPGQLSDQKYFERNIKPTFDRKRYVYKEKRYDLDLPIATLDRLSALCNREYADFRELARRELGLE